MNRRRDQRDVEKLDPALAAFIEQLAIAAVERECRRAKAAERNKETAEQEK